MAPRVISVPVVFVRAVVPVLLTYAVLLAWGFLQWQVHTKAPPGKMAGTYTVKASEAPVTVGWRELGQRQGPKSADTQHLLILRRDGQWTFGNRSQNKKVLLTTTRFEARFTDRFPLAKGDRISFPNADIEVRDVAPSRLVLFERKSGRELVWDGRLRFEDKDLYVEICLGRVKRWFADAKWTSRNWTGENRPELRLFSIGGGLNCADRWQMPGLAPEAVWIVWQGGRFWAAPGTSRDETLLVRAGQTRGQGFGDLIAPLQGDYGRIESMVVGITRYRVVATDAELKLIPVTNRLMFFGEDPDPPNLENVDWLGTGADALTWARSRTLAIGVGLAIAGGLALVAMFVWSRRTRTYGSLVHALGAIVPSFIGLWIAALLQQGAGNPDQALIVWVALAGWSWASFMLVWSGRLQSFAGWIWALATCLAAIGMVVLFQLGAGADNTRWLGFFRRHATVLALFAWGMAFIQFVPDRWWRRFWLWMFSRELAFAAIGVFLVGFLLLQVMFGSEEGIWGLQPVEFVKTILVILLGFVGLHLAEARERETRAFRRSPLKALLPYIRIAGIFFLFIFAAAVGVRDFSPIIIMLTIIAAFVWKIGTWRGGVSGMRFVFWAIRPLMALAAVGIAYGMYWIYENPDAIPEWLPKKDRILVWAEPQYHPHTGSQVLGSMDLVGDAGWFGGRAWFGRNGPAMGLPEVQNDFVGAFLINRFGGAAGMLLLAVEVCYVTLIFMLGRAVEATLGRGDFREQNPAVVLSYALYGMGCMHIAHWLISWGNVLGLLPVMGQPMTWVTAGNSHLMFFAMAVLIVCQVTGWTVRHYAEEIKSSGAVPLREKD